MPEQPKSTSSPISLEWRARETDALNEAIRTNNLGNAYYVINSNSNLYADENLSQVKYVVEGNTAFAIKNVILTGGGGNGDIIYELKDNLDNTSIYIKGGAYHIGSDTYGKLDSNLYSAGDIRYGSSNSLANLKTAGGQAFSFDDTRIISYSDGTAGGGASAGGAGGPGGGGSGGSGGGNGSDEIYPSTANAVNTVPAWFSNIEDHLGYDEKKSFKKMSEEVSKHGYKYRSLRTVLGMPYQFLPSTDCRIDQESGSMLGLDDDSTLEYAGYEFTEKILSRMSLLFITPGNTAFMGQGNEGYKQDILTRFLAGVKTSFMDGTGLDDLLDGYVGKLYTIVPAIAEYFNYVNPMTRMGALFLGIEDKDLNGKSPATFHWGWNVKNTYTLSSVVQDSIDKLLQPDVNAGIFSVAKEFVSDIQSMLYYSDCIPLYINSDVSFQDTFSNDVADSSLATAVNALSDRAREIQFLLGTASSAVGDAFDRVNMDSSFDEVKTAISNITSKISGGNSIFSTIANSVKTIVSGGRILFPQIWTNSNFTKSYSISMKLTTPSYDKFSWWLNIYVPLCHLAALVLPRSEYVNSYTTPFLIKAFYRGMFNIDMGIITEMSFTKGKEGSWTKDGLPTVVDVSFTIQDLFCAMGMTSTGSILEGGAKSMYKGSVVQNVAEMDYFANLCGININEPDTFRMLKLWATFNISNALGDFIPNMSLNLDGLIKRDILNKYSSFWGI